MSDSFMINEKDSKKSKRRIRVNPNRSPLKIFKGKIKDDNTMQIAEDKNEDLSNFSPLVQMMLEQEKTDDLQYQLLKMMYLDDIDSEHVENYLGISSNELKTVVEELVFMGLLQYTSDDEVELTEDGIVYVTYQDLKEK